MDQQWSARAFQNGDEEAILELQQAIYGEVADKNRWLRWWNWKYKQNPAGEAIIQVACRGNQIVAQYAITPVKMKFGGRFIAAAQSVDTMTHPEYQGRGIFTALSAEVFREAARRNVAIIYGLPNKLTSWHEKNWLKIGRLEFMIKPIDTNKIIRKYISPEIPNRICAGLVKMATGLLFHERRDKSEEGISITRITAFDKRADGLWETVSGDYKIGVVKDKVYLNWRYTGLSENEYEIYFAEKQGKAIGYLVLKCLPQQGLNAGYILDLMVPLREQAVARSLVRKALEIFREKQADIVFYPSIASRMLKKTLRKTGIFSFPPLNNKLPFVARANVPDIPEPMLCNPENWLVQMGDSDNL